MTHANNFEQVWKDYRFSGAILKADAEHFYNAGLSENANIRAILKEISDTTPMTAQRKYIAKRLASDGGE